MKGLRLARFAALLVFLFPFPLWSEEPKSDFFEAAGVKIHYVRQGAGEPVVLIHGLYASAAINWQWPGVFAVVAKDHDVIALDLPGHGLSDKPDNASAYGKQMSEDVLLLMNHLKIGKAHIVGYSLGGIVALRFIVDHPDHVLSGTLGGMGWLQQGGPRLEDWESMRAFPFFSTPTVCIRSVVQLAVSDTELNNVKTPMKVLVGAQDFIRQLYVAPLQAARPDWPVVLIPNAGHLECVGQPLFKSELEAWLNSNRHAGH